MRNKALLSFALALAVLLCPEVVWAASAEGEGWGWWETLGRWLNLLVIFGVIFYAVRKPAAKFFKDRRANIQKEMREAERVRAEADRRLAEIEQRLQGLDQELAKIRQEAEENAARERHKILDQAQQEAEKMLASAEREIEGLGRSVRKDLKQYAAQLAVELAEIRIRRRLGREEENRLAERLFADLEAQTRSRS